VGGVVVGVEDCSVAKARRRGKKIQKIVPDDFLNACFFFVRWWRFTSSKGSLYPNPEVVLIGDREGKKDGRMSRMHQAKRQLDCIGVAVEAQRASLGKMLRVKKREKMSKTDQKTVDWML
jgi:hypothetical protein